MRILWGEGVVLSCVGVSEWVVSGNERLTEERVFVFFVCMFGAFDEVKVLLN